MSGSGSAALIMTPCKCKILQAFLTWKALPINTKEKQRAICMNSLCYKATRSYITLKILQNKTSTKTTSYVYIRIEIESANVSNTAAEWRTGRTRILQSLWDKITFNGKMQEVAYVGTSWNMNVNTERKHRSGTLKNIFWHTLLFTKSYWVLYNIDGRRPLKKCTKKTKVVPNNY